MKVAQGVLTPVFPKRECSTFKPELCVCVCVCVSVCVCIQRERFPLLRKPGLSAEEENLCNNHMPINGN